MTEPLDAVFYNVVPASWSEVGVSTSGSAVNADHAAVSTQRHVVTQIIYAYTGAPASATVEIREDPAGDNTLRFSLPVPENGITNPDPRIITFRHPMVFAKNKTVRASLSASTGVIGHINMLGYSVPPED